LTFLAPDSGAFVSLAPGGCRRYIFDHPALAAGKLLKAPAHRAEKFLNSFKVIIMGRGDKKTKKGKIFKGSFGKSRPAKPAKKSTVPAAPAAKDK
jgi:30S ribosomal protein S31